MTDIAKIGVVFDTSELREGVTAIRAVVPSAKEAEQATERLETALHEIAGASKVAKTALGSVAASSSETANALNKFAQARQSSFFEMSGFDPAQPFKSVVVSAGHATTAANGFASGMNDVTASTMRTTSALNGFATANKAAFLTSDQLARAQRSFANSMDEVVSSTVRVGRGMDFANGEVAKVRRSANLTAQDMLNLGRQGADVGVTLAMGMNPFMIAVQQGPQILDALQVAALRTGTTISAVFRLLGAAIWAALAPILPFMLAVAAGVGAVVGAFALFSRAVTKGGEDVTKGMGLTEEQLKRVEKSGVETAVTLGDTFFATFEVIGKYIADGPVGKAWDWLTGKIGEGLDWLTKASFNAVAMLVGGFVGGIRAIGKNWRNLPAITSDVLINIVNGTLKTIADMINGMINLINGATDKINSIFGTSVGKIAPVSFRAVENPFAGAVAAFGVDMRNEVNAAVAETKSGMIAIGNEIGAAARRRAEKRVRDVAGDAPKGGKGEKTQAAKFDDIVGGAERDIAETRAKIAGVNLSAEAATRLANEQKLLNEASSRGIQLLPQQRAQLMELAGTLTDLQTELANLEGFKAISEGAQATVDALKAEAAMIGLTGAALVSKRTETELLAAAKAKDIVLTDKQTEALKAYAAQIGKQSAENEALRFMEAQSAETEARLDALKAEVAMIGLTGAALVSKRTETELLAAAKAKDIELTDKQTEALKAYAAQIGEKTANNEKLRFMEAQRAEGKERLTQLKEELDYIGLSADDTLRLRRENELLAQARAANVKLSPEEVEELRRVAAAQTDVEIAIRRTKEALDFSRSATRGFLGDLTSSLRQGETLWKSFGNAVIGVLNKIIDRMLDAAVEGLFNPGKGKKGFDPFGALIRAVTGGVTGGISVGGGDKITKAAKGEVLGFPRLITHAAGATLAGEAGKEAVMPLHRGPDGSLGIQMYNGERGSGGVKVEAPIIIHQTFSGVMTGADVQNIARGAAQEARDQMKREVVPLLQQYQVDGAIT